jgi:4-hydroxybenzoate polyprenyltransferase
MGNSLTMKKLLSLARDYFSLVRFSHTVFAMPFALIGFSLAIKEGGHAFSLKLLVLIILCMIFARNAAMSFNRLVDKNFDSINERTRHREIPAGKISVKGASAFVIVNVFLFILTTGFINRLTLFLSPVALLIILGYSFTKRFTSLCHFVLGLGLSLAPIGAYISVTGKFDILPLIYSFIVLTWVSGFDIIYALQDDDFDRETRLHSIPSAKGRKGALIISAGVHMVTIILVIAAGLAGNYNIIYWTGAAVFIMLLIYQHLIIKHDDISRVSVAFGTVNSISGLVYSIFVISGFFINL